MDSTDDFKKRVCKALSEAAYRLDIHELVAEAYQVGAIVRQTWPAAQGGPGFSAYTASLSLGTVGEAVVIIFRGTKGATEWLAYPHALAGEVFRTAEGLTAFTPFLDALEEMWEEPGDWVHGNAAESSMEDAISGALNSGREVWLTGHSRGGAIASIAAALLVCGEESRQRDNHLRRLSVMTFNAPMALDAGDVMRYEEARERHGIEHRRIEHRGDMVRHMPAGLGLKHSGDKEAHGKRLTESGEFARTITSALSAFAAAGTDRNLVTSGENTGHEQASNSPVMTQNNHSSTSDVNNLRSSFGSLASAFLRSAAHAHR